MRAHGLFCCLLALVLVLPARDLRADTVARVVIVRPAGGDTLLNEALIRTRGELRAVGLTVEIQLAEERADARLTDAVYGTLVFRRSSGRIEIEAIAPGVDTPVIQIVDTSQPALDAEVVSVRAVEALRAAMLQFAKRARASEQVLPEAVVGFTKLDRPPATGPAEAEEPPRPGVPKSEPPAERPSPPPDGGDASDEGVRFSVWLGSEFSLDVEPALPNLGARMTGYASWHWIAAGLSLEQSFGVRPVDANEGSAGVSRSGALAQLKAELRLSPRVSPFIQLGLGVRRYRVSGAAERGFGERVASHWSGATAIDFGSTYHLFRSLGAYLSMGARLATDAPQLRFAERPVAVLDRPSVAVAGGLILGAL